MLPGNIPACLAVTSWGLSPEARCIMGDCACLRLTSPTIPFAEAATASMVRSFFPADPGTVLQHLRLRNREAAFTSSRYRETHVCLNCFWCIFSCVINSLFKTWCTVYLQYTSGALTRPWSDLWPLFCRWGSLCSSESMELNLLLRTHYCELDFTSCR